MLLYKNKRAFNALIKNTSDYFSIATAIVIKDYFVTVLLKELQTICPNMVFKGGTSLSKCFQIIERFSEDIDVSMVSLTLGQRKRLKKSIESICSRLNLKIINKDKIWSHKRFNRYEIEYPHTEDALAINKNILLETTFISKTYPIIEMPTISYLYKYLKVHKNDELINLYELNPFLVKTQTLEKTFIDKVFAICDYYLKKKVLRSSRHIYDLYFLDKYINYDDNLNELIKKVYEERSQIESCLSAQADMSVNKILEEIINTNYFKEDYIQLTNQISIQKVDYDKSIAVLKKIISLKIFK